MARVGGDFVLGLQILVDHSLINVVRHGRLDLELVLIEFLDGHSIQRQRSNRSIWVLRLVSHISNEKTDVLLQLSQVQHDVVLIEYRRVVILIVLCHREEEVGSLEGFDHAPDVVLDGHQLRLDVLDLVVLLLGEAVALLDLLGESVADILLFFLGELSQLLVSLDFLLDLLVLLLNHVNLGVDLVNIVEQRVVLLVSLDEGCDDFFDRSDTCLLLDLGESILNDVDVSNVHIHQVLLLFVIVGPLLESQLEKSCGIGKLARSSGSGISWTSGSLALCLLQLGIVLLPKLLLQVQNAALELLLLLLVLCLQGKNLIVELFGNSLPVVRYIIELERLVLDALHFAVVIVVHAQLILLLLPHHINLVPEALVLRLQLVQVLVVLVELVFKFLDFVGVLLHLGSGWTLRRQTGLLLFVLILGGFDRVLEDHQPFLFVL